MPQLQVSPAHAGIDRAGTATACAIYGFPRPRGDRPTSPYRYGDIDKFPPPTRG